MPPAPTRIRTELDDLDYTLKGTNKEGRVKKVVYRVNRMGDDTVVEMEFYRVNQNEFGQEYLATVDDAQD